MITLRQGDRAAARDAFSAAVAYADQLLEQTPQNYRALDTKGLALARLALVEGMQHLEGAAAAYRAARKLTMAAGIVAGELKLLDALAIGDEQGVLTAVCEAVQGA